MEDCDDDCMCDDCKRFICTVSSKRYVPFKPICVCDKNMNDKPCFSCIKGIESGYELYCTRCEGVICDECAVITWCQYHGAICENCFTGRIKCSKCDAEYESLCEDAGTRCAQKACKGLIVWTNTIYQ